MATDNCEQTLASSSTERASEQPVQECMQRLSLQKEQEAMDIDDTPTQWYKEAFEALQDLEDQIQEKFQQLWCQHQREKVSKSINQSIQGIGGVA